MTALSKIETNALISTRLLLNRYVAIGVIFIRA